ncbi:hypothetical protein K8I28_04465 [bacterium]|nr:hypothetical protein [bacterium]
MKDHSEIQPNQTYTLGLEHLVAGTTEICKIDGTLGKLWYRGYSIEDIVDNLSFEEVAWLILDGELPRPPELSRWRDEISSWRNAPSEAIAVLHNLPDSAHPLALFRTTMTVASCYMPTPEDLSKEAQWRRPARILSWASMLAAASIRHLKKLPPLPPRQDLSFAEHFLWQSLGAVPDAEDVRAFEVSLLVQAEHELHAAAFASLVVASTGADLGGAVLAGMGALSGKLHGGANQEAFQNITEFKEVREAENWANERLVKKYRFPGFGHRVYKTHDPRAKVLEPFAESILKRHGLARIWDNYCAVKNCVEKQLGDKGIFANVDAVTGMIYHALGLPIEAFPIPFCLAISTGWMAHALEYIPDGKLIEPGAIYVGNR